MLNPVELVMPREVPNQQVSLRHLLAVETGQVRSRRLEPLVLQIKKAFPAFYSQEFSPFFERLMTTYSMPEMMGVLWSQIKFKACAFAASQVLQAKQLFSHNITLKN